MQQKLSTSHSGNEETRKSLSALYIPSKETKIKPPNADFQMDSKELAICLNAFWKWESVQMECIEKNAFGSLVSTIKE